MRAILAAIAIIAASTFGLAACTQGGGPGMSRTAPAAPGSGGGAGGAGMGGGGSGY